MPNRGHIWDTSSLMGRSPRTRNHHHSSSSLLPLLAIPDTLAPCVPPGSGKRYCMNAGAMTFVPK